MSEEWDDRQIANETFKLLLSAFSWKDERINEKDQEKMSKKFKTYMKKFFLLFCINEQKNCTLSDLEHVLLENRSTISLAVSKLFNEDLISKHQPKKGEDGRKVYFRITGKGKETLKMYENTFVDDIRYFYGELTEESKKNYKTGIMSLNKVFVEKKKIEHKEM